MIRASIKLIKLRSLLAKQKSNVSWYILVHLGVMCHFLIFQRTFPTIAFGNPTWRQKPQGFPSHVWLEGNSLYNCWLYNAIYSYPLFSIIPHLHEISINIWFYSQKSPYHDYDFPVKSPWKSPWNPLTSSHRPPIADSTWLLGTSVVIVALGISGTWNPGSKPKIQGTCFSIICFI